MSAAEILTHLRTDGIRLRADGENLIAEPKAAITDAHRFLIRSNKSELIALLAANDGPESPPTRVRLQLVVETAGRHKGVTMLGAISQTQEQAIESARSRFGNRLISAQEESR